MNFTPDELAARLKLEGESVQAFFQGLTPDQWDLPVYMEGSVWWVRDILAHFTAAEQGFHDLIQDVAAGGPGAPENYAIDDYNRHTVTEAKRQDAAVLLGQFAMTRERTIALVKALNAQQLEHVGRHPYVGQATLSEIIRAIYHHNSLHVRDVKRVLKAAGSSRLASRGVTG